MVDALTSNELRMDAYYYSFGSAGVPEIDLILSAVACAGKAYHHTECWQDECEWEPHEGKSPVDWIYNAAVRAAEEIKKLRHELEIAKLGRAAAAHALAEEWQKQPPTDEPPASRTNEEVSSNQKVHELKCWPEFYRYVADGSKPFEVRKNDRGFKAGDVLVLREWNPVMEAYTGNECRREVTYVLYAFPGLPGDMCVMGLRRSEPPSPTHEAVYRFCDYLKEGNCKRCPAHIQTVYGPGQPGCFAVAHEHIEKATEALRQPLTKEPSRGDDIEEQLTARGDELSLRAARYIRQKQRMLGERDAPEQIAGETGDGQ